MRYSLFWDVTQCWLVASCRRFGTTYRSHLQGSSSQTRLHSIWTAWPLEDVTVITLETSVINYHSALRNIAEERRSTCSEFPKASYLCGMSSSLDSVTNKSLYALKLTSLLVWVIDVVTGFTNFCDCVRTDILTQRSGDAFTPVQVLVPAECLPDCGFSRYNQLQTASSPIVRWRSLVVQL